MLFNIIDMVLIYYGNFIVCFIIIMVFKGDKDVLVVFFYLKENVMVKFE